MKRFVWAAVLAVPVFAATQQRASAEGGFCWMNDFCRFRLKFCAQCYPNCHCPFEGGWGGPACAGGGCGWGGGWGGWGGGDACGASFDQCHGVVPGPWYTFWPYGGAPFMTSPYTSSTWTYDSNFQGTPPSAFPFWGP